VAKTGRPKAPLTVTGGQRSVLERGARAATSTQAYALRCRNPHLTDGFKLSADPLLAEKVVDVVGLYHNPPERAVVLCADESMRAHDYARPGSASLLAAFNSADGAVLSELHRRRRTADEIFDLLARYLQRISGGNTNSELWQFNF
jgi:hypothetical protein